LESGIQRLGIRNPALGIRNPPNDWIPLHGASIKMSGEQCKDGGGRGEAEHKNNNKKFEEKMQRKTPLLIVHPTIYSN